MNIAVLMSTYNGEAYLREQIGSILSQEGDFSLELWVRDDGSRDGTVGILEEYAAEGKLQWYAGPNLGSAHSFLDLIHHCPGCDFYAFADQDDYWMPDKIQSGIQAMSHVEPGRPALYFANAELVGRELESLGRNVYRNTPKTDFETLACAGGYLGCTMVFNSALAERIRRKDHPKKIIMHDFFAALVCAAFDGAIFYDEIPHMKYRQHGSNVVGVSQGTIRRRVREITQKPAVGVAEQAQSILELYRDDLDEQKRDWLETVRDYKKTILSRAKLACSRRTSYINKNMSITLRLSLLLGSR